MSARDDFTELTKRQLAERVGWRCSFPDCGDITVGPSPDNNRDRINLGIAAHIRGAAPGGARFDPNMTSQQRRDIGNGIWMCRKHAALIDVNKSAFSVEQLHRMKNEAERLAYSQIFKIGTRQEDGDVILDPVEEFVGKHRVFFGSKLKDENFFRVYNGVSSDAVVLDGVAPICIEISKKAFRINFNYDNDIYRCRDVNKEYVYIGETNLDPYLLVDDCVRFFFDRIGRCDDCDDYLYSFELSIDEYGYVGIRGKCSRVVIFASLHVEDGIVTDDLDERLGPTDEIYISSLFNTAQNIMQSNRFSWLGSTFGS